MTELEDRHFTSQQAQLGRDGFCILPKVLSPDTVAWMREKTRANVALMGQTRDCATSYHLAGFHRFSAFEGMARLIATNPTLRAFLDAHFTHEVWGEIGLTDITVNRSQHWHTDLLRGKYAQHLQEVDPWEQSHAPCIKALAYLQDGKSLRIVSGSHLDPTPLDDVALEDLANTETVTQLEVQAGDIVLMDIRALHRGSTDQEMTAPTLAVDPKILVSMVFGQTSSDFVRAMETGNARRMAEWDGAHLPETARENLLARA